MARTEQERILIALDACCDLSSATMETVVTMAARLGAALEGIFVEDVELLRAAELPFAREVVAAGSERVLTVESLRQVNREMSAELERRVAEVARRRNVRWRYTVAEGSRLLLALEAAAECDLFMPGRPARRPGTSPASERGRFRRVGVFYDDTAPAERALAVVRALAAEGGTRELVLVCQSQPSRALLSELAAQGLTIFVHAASLTDAQATLVEVRSHEPGLLIAPKRMLTGAGETDKARVLDVLPMSLLLLR